MQEFLDALKSFGQNFVTDTGLTIVRTIAFFCSRTCHYKDRAGYYQECFLKEQQTG